jgi:hypothetical protein
MCRPGVSLPGLLLMLLAGCVGDHVAPATALVSGFRGPVPSSSDAVEMIVALIERRAGDPYLDKEVWTFTDEQIVELEHKAVLEDNGFRVGQIVGMTPAGLQSLLTSERACTRANCYFLGQGKSETLVLGGPVPRCRFQIIQQGKPVELTFDEARFALIVQPQWLGDGRMRFHFTPQVQFGDKKLRDFRIAADGSGLEMQNENPGQSFPALSWDVTVPPSQYVLVGGRLDQAERIGHRCFVQADGASAVQRLLVIRTSRVAGRRAEADASATPRDAGDLFVPLALQSTWPCH